MPQQTRTGIPSTLSLPSDLEIRIERTFNAPVEKTWRAWTEAKLLPKWMGPAKYTMTTSEMDVRAGGTYRWVWDIGGNDLVIHGDFLDADKPNRMVTRERMEPHPGYALNLIVFTERDGKTTVAVHITCGSKEARDAMLASGMKDGMEEGYARLDALLAEMT